MAPSVPLVFRADLPSPDVVVVRDADGAVTLFADSSLPETAVDSALADLDAILAGQPHALR